ESILGSIMIQDVDDLVEPFKSKSETRLWQSEFWGKWMLSACEAYGYTRSSELLKKIEYAVSELLKTQLPNGYIGNYSAEAQLEEWDVWGRKYTLLGLQAFYKIPGDKQVLQACKRVADHLMTQ